MRAHSALASYLRFPLRCCFALFVVESWLCSDVDVSCGSLMLESPSLTFGLAGLCCGARLRFFLAILNLALDFVLLLFPLLSKK